MEPIDHSEGNLTDIVKKLRKISLSVQEFGFDYFFSFYEIRKEELEDEEDKAYLFCVFSSYYLLYMLYHVSEDLSYKRFFPANKELFELFNSFVYNSVVSKNSFVINDYEFIVEEDEYSDLNETAFQLQNSAKKSSASVYDDDDMIKLKLEKQFFSFFERKIVKMKFVDKEKEHNILRVKFEFHCPFINSFNNKVTLSGKNYELLSRYGTKELVGIHSWDEINFRSLLLPCEDSKFGYLFLMPTNKKENIDIFAKQMLLSCNNEKNFFTRIAKYQKHKKMDCVTIPKLNINFSTNIAKFFKKKNLNTTNLFNFLSNRNMNIKKIHFQCHLLINEKGRNIIPDDVTSLGVSRKRKKKLNPNSFICDRDFVLFLVYLPINLLISFGVIKLSNFQ